MKAQPSAVANERQAPSKSVSADLPAGTRIILIRHGRPNIPVSLRTSQKEFGKYIDAYEEAGLDPESAPPEELQDLVSELTAVFTSGRKRAHDSAKALAPGAELIADPLFQEAPLALPPIPILRMRVPKWAVVARILWHAGYHPEIENYRHAKTRATEAADILMRRAVSDGTVALVAHGYFNLILGRELRRRGFERSGSHRARFWNAVIYQKSESAAGASTRRRRRKSKPREGE